MNNTERFTNWALALTDSEFAGLLRVTEDAGDATVEGVILDELSTAVDELRSVTRQIDVQLRRVRDDLEGVERNLRFGYTLNDLGEFQGSADRLDTLIALRSAAIKRVVRAATRVEEFTAWTFDTGRPSREVK